MTEPAIQARGLGKFYRLGEGGGRAGALSRLLRRAPLDDAATPPFWALRDVGFEIAQGEVVGLIGRNGAGKSTLLKILSRITDPSEGEADIRGRVSSLLEVGTGFHPELTGRENVYLNGSILGMSRAEIARKMPEIAAFAEIDPFLDTPIKRYSSGMHARLAFAIAAHLDPDILMIDEALAVGDVSFQKKCMAKMESVARGGKTVFFVSHSMAAIESLTRRCLWLERGRLAMDGETGRVVQAFLDSLRESAPRVSVADWPERAGSGRARVIALRLRVGEGTERANFRPGEPILIELDIDFAEPLLADIEISFESQWQRVLFTTRFGDSAEPRRWEGRRTFSARFEPNRLRHGAYLLSVTVMSPDMHDCHDAALHFPAFEIVGHSAELPLPTDARAGELYFPMRWKAGD